MFSREIDDTPPGMVQCSKSRSKIDEPYTSAHFQLDGTTCPTDILRSNNLTQHDMADLMAGKV